MTSQWRDRGLDRFANLMSRWVPDAVTAGVILTFLTLAIALALGNSASRVLDAYHQGLWMLLPFTMQMTLILVLSLALATTPFFRGTHCAPGAASQIQKPVHRARFPDLRRRPRMPTGDSATRSTRWSPSTLPPRPNARTSTSTSRFCWPSPPPPRRSGNTVFPPARRCWWPARATSCKAPSA